MFHLVSVAVLYVCRFILYTQSSEDQAAGNLETGEPGVTSATAAIIIPVVCNCAIYVHSLQPFMPDVY